MISKRIAHETNDLRSSHDITKHTKQLQQKIHLGKFHKKVQDLCPHEADKEEVCGLRVLRGLKARGSGRRSWNGEWRNRFDKTGPEGDDKFKEIVKTIHLKN